MSRSGAKILIAAAAVLGLALAAAPKEADAVSLNMINTWKMGDGMAVNYGNANTGWAAGGPAWSKGGFPTPGVNLHFGIGLGRGDQILPYIGLALQRRQYTYDWDPRTDDNDLEVDDDTGAATQFGFQIGAKFFFIERAKGKAPPFIQLSFYKYVSAITEDGDYDGFPPGHGDGKADNGNGPDYAYYDQQINSPQGFNFSFGAEYYFNDNFALGGEFFGLDFSWSRATNPFDIDLIDTRMAFNFYTALTLTYRFSFSVRASVQFESDYDYED